MLEYRLLGPLEVLRDGHPVTLGKGAERALIALLVLHAGRPLSADAVIGALWGERAPATAREMVRNYVGSARRHLGSDTIETTQHGYVLAAADSAIDVRRFELLAREGADALAAGDADAAVIKVEEALALWRGRPLPELDNAADTAGHIRQLEDLYSSTREDWFETQLELGHTTSVVSALEAFVGQHPYRERSLGQLMLALYRCGRQTDALDRFASARRRLVDELGLEPSPELRELQARILRHDPSLDVHLEQPSQSAAGPRRSARRVVIAAALFAAVSAVVVGVVLLGSHAEAVAVPARGVVELDEHSGKPVRAMTVAFEPGPLAVSNGGVWLGDPPDRSLVELQPRRQRIRLPREPFAVAAWGDAIWVANGFDGTLIRVDGSGHASKPIRPTAGSTGRLPLAIGRGVLWVGSQNGTLSELTLTGRTIAVIPKMGSPETIAAGKGSVWVGRATEDTVVRVDDYSPHLRATIPIGGRPDIVAVGDTAIWALTADASTLWRIDPGTNAVTASVPLPAQPTALAITPNGVWVGSAGGILTQINPATNSVERTRVIGRSIDALTAANGRLWATVG